MATLTPTQNSADGNNQSGGQPKTSKIVIGTPFTIGNITDNIVNFIQVDGGPRLVSGWKIHDGSLVEVFGKGLDRYNQIALWIGGGRELIEDGDVRKKAGGQGLEFTAKFSKDTYTDISPIEVEFLQYNNPDADRLLEKHFFYIAETPEQKQKRKALEAEEARQRSIAGGSGPSAVSEFVNAGLSPIGAVVNSLKSADNTSPVGAKAAGPSPVATKSATGAETSSTGSSQADFEVGQSAGQETIGRTISSTSQISTGGQTVSRGSTNVAQTISSGGTVKVSASQNLGEQISSTVRAAAGQVSSTATASGGGQSQVSGTANLNSGVTSEGQTNASRTVTGQSQVTQKVTADGSATTTAAAPAAANLSAGQSTTDVRQSQNLSADGSAALKTSSTFSQGLNFSASGGTAGLGVGLPPVGGQTVVAPTSPAPQKQQQPEQESKQESARNNLPENKPEPQKTQSDNQQNSAESLSSLNSQIHPSPVKPAPVANQPAPKPQPASEVINRLRERGKELRLRLEGVAPGVLPSEQNVSAITAQERDSKKQTTRAQGSPASEPGMSAPLGDLPNANRQDREASDGRRSPGQPVDSAKPRQNFQDETANLGQPIGGQNQNSQQPNEASSPQAESNEPSQEQNDVPKGAQGPSRAQNRDPRNVFKDPRPKPSDDADEEQKPPIEKNNPAAFATVRRLLNKKSALAAKGIGQASSKIWYYGLASSSATFFTGLDFMLGAVVMDAYWIFGHRKDPELFPLKLWQKIVTVAANVIPPILIVLIFALIMVVGCNYPAPIKTAVGDTYRLTVIGSIIGDDCKYFDVTNLISAAAPAPTAPAPTTNASSGQAVAPRGP